MSGWKQNGRVILVALLAIAGFCGLGTRLALLHLRPGDALIERVRRMRHMEHSLSTGRGRIFDRNGVPVAMDLSMKHVCVDPQILAASPLTNFAAHHLSRLLNVEPDFVRERLQRPDRRCEYISKFVPDDLAKQVMRLQIPGVFLEDTSKRHYPAHDLMCHVVGFSNMEGDGSGGIEQRLDSDLRGRPGVRVTERDGKKREIYGRRSLDIPPIEGADVYLTLDMTVQHLVERALDRAMEQHKAKGGWAIAQRVRTGEILALASCPDFDLNDYGTSTEEQRRNRAISYVYEPGSTFKVAVIAAALNEGLVRPEQVFNCENGRWIYNNRPLNDYHPYGLLSVADIVKKSSNIGAAKIALLLGNKKLETYLRAFGFGSKSGVDLPGEEGGILHPASKWSNISATRVAMGHEVAVTALQMLNAVSAIANDGFLMRPQVIRRVVGAGGKTLYEAEPEVLGRPIRADTARVMRELLERAVGEGGTGRKAAIEGYRVAGKTGSAQKPVPGGYSDYANMASFAGFFPAENPEVAMIFVVDEPQPLHTGGAVAAPIFAEVGGDLARYLATRPGAWLETGHLAEQPPREEPDASIVAFVNQL